MEEELIRIFESQEIYGDRVARWAILQHYEICQTPLLDVTNSLRVAISFATESGDDEAFLYLLAVPHVAGPISISLQAGTHVISLAQLCAPEAFRPHFQEAVLIGNYPTADQAAVKASPHAFMPYIAQNFACRLVAKFRLLNCNGWGSEGFGRLPSSIMYPNVRDAVFRATEHLRQSPS